jgi:5-methylcytosine-specific restriction endonuclease McrA
MCGVVATGALVLPVATAFAADGVSGTWVSGEGTSATVYVFKMQTDGFIGAACGPCDDSSTVFRIADGRVIDAGHVTFSIVRDGQTTPAVSKVTLKRVVTDAPGAASLVANVNSRTPSPRANSWPLDGRWVAAGRVAQQNVTLKLRDGNRIWGVICGPCSNPDGVFLIEDGALEGDAISFFIHHIDTPAAGVRQNGPGRNFMKGTVTGNVMKFKWVREGRESEPGGEMTLIGPIR